MNLTRCFEDAFLPIPGDKRSIETGSRSSPEIVPSAKTCNSPNWGRIFSSKINLRNFLQHHNIFGSKNAHVLSDHDVKLSPTLKWSHPQSVQPCVDTEQCLPRCLPLQGLSSFVRIPCWHRILHIADRCVFLDEWGHTSRRDRAFVFSSRKYLDVWDGSQDLSWMNKLYAIEQISCWISFAIST